MLLTLPDMRGLPPSVQLKVAAYVSDPSHQKYEALEQGVDERGDWLIVLAALFEVAAGLPVGAPARVHLAYTLARVGRRIEAAEVYDAWLESKPESIRFRVAAAYNAIRAGDFESAKAHFRSCSRLHLPSADEKALELAFVMRFLGTSDLVPQLREAVEDFPQNDEGRSVLVQAAIRADDADMLVTVLRRFRAGTGVWLDQHDGKRVQGLILRRLLEVSANRTTCP